MPPLRCGSEWTEEGQLWVQYVSSTPATRLDVINLQEQLDQRLTTRQARETGICPVREELYAQCFDDLECASDVPSYDIRCERGDDECTERRRRLAAAELKEFQANPGGFVGVAAIVLLAAASRLFRS